jgi:hypothetical protein
LVLLIDEQFSWQVPFVEFHEKNVLQMHDPLAPEAAVALALAIVAQFTAHADVVEFHV